MFSDNRLCVTVASSCDGNLLLWLPLYLGSKLRDYLVSVNKSRMLYQIWSLGERNEIKQNKITLNALILYLRCRRFKSIEKNVTRMLVGASLNNLCGLGLICVART